MSLNPETLLPNMLCYLCEAIQSAAHEAQFPWLGPTKRHGGITDESN